MKILFIFTVAVVLFIVYVRYLESRSIFFPSTKIIATPEDVGLPFEDVFIKAEDGVTLHGWFVKSATLSNKILIFLHGNAGNISGRLEKIKLFHRMGLSVLIVDYRGYGKSEGKPSEAGMYKDAEAVYEYVIQHKDVSHENIIVYGASLGGAVAVDLASKHKVSHLIVDSSFTNAVDMAKRIFPFAPSFLIKTKLDSLNKIKKVDASKLFIHSREDEIVPFILGQKLYEAAPSPKEFLEIKGGHNDGHIYDGNKFAEGIRNFLKQP